MKKIWIVAGLICVGGVALLESPAPMERHAPPSGLVLTGQLLPVVSAIVPAREVRLETPLYSWVFKGQVIGEGLVETRRSRVRFARRGSEPDATLESVRHEMDKDETALIDAELAWQQAESRLSAATLRFRQQTGSVLEEDEAVSEVERTESAVDGARRSFDSDMARVSGLEVYRRTERGTRRSALPDAVDLTPVLAPLDGMLVPAGGSGEVGVAADPDAVCIQASIPAHEIDAVRVGSIVKVKVDGSNAIVSARVTEIGSSPIESRGRSVYPVTLLPETTRAR